jgi:hypothetical protein
MQREWSLSSACDGFYRACYAELSTGLAARAAASREERKVQPRVS